MGDPRTRQPLNPGSPRCRLLILLLVLLAPAAAADSLRVLSQNMNRLFDDVDDGNREKVLSRARFERRVALAVARFGEDYGLPQIIALQEVENLHVLERIAAGLKARYGTRYRPLLIPGHDPSGINLGYLVDTRIDIRRYRQLFHDLEETPGGNALFTRPPLLLQACYLEKCLTLLNLHLRSMRGIGGAESERVRRKRLRQAEAIAAWSQQFQHSEPRARLLILGDLNALTPSDAHVDVAGILRGAPDNARAGLRGRDLLDPDLVDLTLSIPLAERHSYRYRGQSQQLDYMLVNTGFDAALDKIAFGSLDFRFSDHAGLLAQFDW